MNNCFKKAFTDPVAILEGFVSFTTLTSAVQIFWLSLGPLFPSMKEAMEKLRAALEATVHIEKGYLDKVRPQLACCLPNCGER